MLTFLHVLFIVSDIMNFNTIVFSFSPPNNNYHVIELIKFNHHSFVLLKENTFQAVLATDGTLSFAIFLYQDVVDVTPTTVTLIGFSICASVSSMHVLALIKLNQDI